jgi:hypothetical protein
MPTLELQAAMRTACCAHKNEERDRDTQRHTQRHTEFEKIVNSKSGSKQKKMKIEQASYSAHLISYFSATFLYLSALILATIIGFESSASNGAATSNSGARVLQC